MESEIVLPEAKYVVICIIHHMLKMNKYLSHVISITLLHSNCRTNTYKHLTTRQYLVMDVSEIFTSVVMGCKNR
ncbi:hypothetical protein T4D_11681 [Trichinella pseudospiralis]|uniref:Uncharacterized protein n=1 Tax=Trichinella pseudospiralis TaxID=6337 RepID=A0A0V1FME0_TRIPS|nr:hypothetical protein T4D_11681 [Trichinella pseudospiralis]